MTTTPLSAGQPKDMSPQARVAQAMLDGALMAALREAFVKFRDCGNSTTFASFLQGEIKKLCGPEASRLERGAQVCTHGTRLTLKCSQCEAERGAVGTEGVDAKHRHHPFQPRTDRFYCSVCGCHKTYWAHEESLPASAGEAGDKKPKGTDEQCAALGTEGGLQNSSPISKEPEMHADLSPVPDQQGVELPGALAGGWWRLADFECGCRGRDDLGLCPTHKAPLKDADAALREMSKGYHYLARLWKVLQPNAETGKTLPILATQFDNYIAGLRSELDRLKQPSIDVNSKDYIGNGGLS